MNRKLVLKMLGYVLALEAGLLMLPLMVGADVPIRPAPAALLSRIIRPPCERPIPLVKGKCPEGTKGVGMLARRSRD